jgi:N6-L-threonylcarbamoyladenine synthase
MRTLMTSDRPTTKNPDGPVILALESSCDDTGAAIIRAGRVVINRTAGQEIHARYGGVVPELASRAHEQHLVPLVLATLAEAKVAPQELDAVAVTRGPGLLGSLLVGTSFAKAFAAGLGVPLIGVNHMRAHVLAHFIEEPRPPFPFLCLTVSGGHTQLLVVRSPSAFEVLGQTMDDAVGEAFDKAAKLLGLPYPGGPLLDRLAQTTQPGAFANAFRVNDQPGFDFSFSGIKTQILYFLRDQNRLNPAFVEENRPELCAAIQDALVGALIRKLRRAVRETGLKHVAIAGGVAANSGLRAALHATAAQDEWAQVYIPAFEYCTDNAAMVAMAAHFQYEAGDFADVFLSPDPRLRLQD